VENKEEANLQKEYIFNDLLSSKELGFLYLLAMKE